MLLKGKSLLILNIMSDGVNPILGGIMSVLGGATTIAQIDSNEHMANKTNRFNERMLQKQMDYNSAMYERQLSDNLKYSDPQFLRARLENAGYNAGVLASGGNVGQAVNSPQAQGVTPPRGTAIPLDYSGFADTIGAATDFALRARMNQSEIAKINAETDQLRIENKYRAQKLLSEIGEKLATTKDANARAATEDLLRSIRKDMLTQEVATSQEQARKIAVERRGIIIENAMKSAQLQVLPQQLRISLANGVADLALKKANKQLTSAQASHELRKLVETNIRSEIARKQLQWDSRTLEKRVKMVTAELERLLNNRGAQGSLGSIASSFGVSLGDLFR